MSVVKLRSIRVALLLVFVATLGETSCKPDVSDDPDVPGDSRGLVIITLDTVRRDHLPTYGYPRDTARNIASLAERSVVFWNAFAQDTNTNPSHTSLFTGQYPHVHGSQFNGQTLQEGRVTLASILHEAGFRTAAFVSGSSMRSSATGLDRGFEVYDEDFSGKRRDGGETASRALEWLENLRSDEDFFLFIHLFDAHGPYEPKPGYENLYQSDEQGPLVRDVGRYQRPAGSDEDAPIYLNDYVDRYDGLIRYMDDVVADVLAQLNLDQVVLLVMSDHGETLGERYHGLDHGGQVYDEQIRIPMILSLPGVSPKRINSPVESVDVLPTLLEEFGIRLPEGVSIQGHSMAPLIRGEEIREVDRFTHTSARPVEARHADRGYQLTSNRRIHSIRSSDWKLILYPGVNLAYVELYDLNNDPDEKVNVVADHPEERTQLLALLREWLKLGRIQAIASELDPELQEQLRGLGYIDE